MYSILYIYTYYKYIVSYPDKRNVCKCLQNVGQRLQALVALDVSMSFNNRSFAFTSIIKPAGSLESRCTASKPILGNKDTWAAH